MGRVVSTIELSHSPARVMYEGRYEFKTAEGLGWSLVEFREPVLRAGCGVVAHTRTMTVPIAKSVASYWWILLEIQKRSILLIA